MQTHFKTLTFVSGVLLGIVLGEESLFASEIAIFVFLLSVAQGVMYFFEKRNGGEMSSAEGRAHLYSLSLITILFCTGLFIGIIRTQLVEEKIKYVCESTCDFDARVVSSPETKDDHQMFNIQIDKNNLTNIGDEIYDIQITTSLYPKYQIGDALHLSGKVTIPSIVMPHGDTKNIKSFDYNSYLLTKNIGSEMYYPHINLLDNEANTITDILIRWKESLVTRIDSYVSSPASVLASGMLFGVSSIQSELSQTFRTAGLSHIIVLSGFNIVIVISSILFVLGFLPLILRILFASTSVIFFVMMVGGSPSVIRATLMAFIALLALMVGRLYVARQALIISLFAIVMYEPYALMHDVSLHLSFLATVGLVYMSEPLELFFTKYMTHVTSSLREIFITTMSAYFATLPYVMYTFGSVSMYAFVANIFVIPFVPLAMLLSFLVVIASYVSSTFALVIGFVDTIIINYIILVAHTVEGLPFSKVAVTISFFVMCVMYFIIFLLIYFIFIKQKNETLVTFENGNLTDIISY